MSYARFGWGGSDVYVYLDVGGFLCCCACNLRDSWQYDSTDAMVAHLEEHRAAGQCVPQGCIDRLLEEKAENDEWIARYDPEAERRKREERNQKIRDIWEIARVELGYEHPGPEKFDFHQHHAAYEQASTIYEERNAVRESPAG